MATEYLADPKPPSPEHADWAASVEAAALEMADMFASRLGDLRRGLCVLAGTGRPEEAVFRKHVACADALRAEAAELASATRRLQDNHLWSLAARDDLVDPEVAELITTIHEAMESELRDGNVPTPEELAEATRFEGFVAVLVVQKTTALKEKLTRGAAAFAGTPGEEALVQALDKHAAAAEAELAAARAFVTAMRRYRALFAEANNPAASPVHKRPAPETEEDPAGPRQRRRTSHSGSQD
ncbi:hypothetical protein E2562_034184 [Oryza meyeriana var. granulata]|uniref:Uncharacterized protein n=1 Tax=Oryza meyeriana var. granulata TaxID=110450 RepID=A0A6G1F176_9ORYZ|nr:hypothetical protein E2562_034184 [Oryza meyeriana var. granulata]